MSRFSSIQSRLALAIGVVLLIMAVVVGGIAYLVQRHASEDAKIVGELRPQVVLVEDLRHEITLLAAAYRGYRASQEDRFVKEAEAASRSIHEALARYPQLTAPGRVDEDWVTLVALSDSYVQGISQVMASHSNGGQSEYPEELMNIRVELYAVADRIVDRNRADIAAAERQSEEAARTLFDCSVLALVVAVAVGTAFAWGATRSVARNGRRLLEAAEAVEKGDYSSAFAKSDEWAHALSERGSTRDELVLVGARFHHMVHALRSRECWAATRVDLASTLSSHIHLEERASRTLELLARQLGCHLGAIHVLERDSGRLKAVAAYAAADSDVESPVPGEGLLGQAFASSECLVIRDVPEDTRFVVKLGFGQAIPKTILALPLAVGQETFGVLSLASLHRLSEEEIEFVMEARIPIAVGINNAIVHRQIGLLAQELREKNAELEARNSELQAQAEEISAQNEEIRAQAEEIAVQNEELETQRNELVERNEELGRMRAREEMERRKLEILMGSLPEGIVICDGEGSITATNRVAEKLFARPVPYGASSDAYIRELRLYRPDGEMYPSQEFPLVRAAREGVIFNGVEVVVRRSDGREKLLLCNAAPLRDSAGVPMGAVGVFQDITSFKSNLIASKLPEYQDRPL